MIFSNRDLRLEVRELGFGKLSLVALGERGRGRRELVLPSKVEIQKGINPNVTIGMSKTNKPKIIGGDDPNFIYLIVDSGGGYTRRHNGYIKFQEEDGIEILAEGNGAHGDAGRIGQWEVALLKVPVNNDRKTITVQYSGKVGRVEYIDIKGKDVHLIDEEDYEMYLDYLDENGEELPQNTSTTRLSLE